INSHQDLDQTGFLHHTGLRSAEARRRNKPSFASVTVLASALLIVSFAHAARAGSMPIVPLQISTAPANGDLNPYGLAEVPAGFPEGSIKSGQLLVSNFNNSANTQGKGTTIIAVSPGSGKTSLFFAGTPGTPLGFSNALAVAEDGFVFAGSVPTSDPGGTAAEPGALLVIDHKGNLVTQLTTPDKINGPWGMAINDQDDRAQLFVSNVLDGTITRLEVSFAHHSFSVVG